MRNKQEIINNNILQNTAFLAKNLFLSISHENKMVAVSFVKELAFSLSWQEKDSCFSSIFRINFDVNGPF